MSLLWLRFALACYFIGLVYAFVALTRTSDLFSRIALHAASLGMVFHFVSLTELFLSGQVVWASVHNGESLLAFLSMSFFMLIYAIYQTTSPGVVAAASAELSWCRCWLRSRFTNSVRVRRARSTACAAVPVMVRRKDRSGPEISRSSDQWTITTPMV